MPQPPVPEGNDDPRQAAPEASAPEREASLPPAAPATPRFHELDALRATAMLLGIVLHAFLFLIPQAWPIQHPDPPALLYWTCFERYSRLSHAGFLPAERILHGHAVGAAWTAPIGAAPRQADRVATRIGVHHRNSGQRVGLHGGPVCHWILAVLLVVRLPPPVVSLDAPLVVRRIPSARAVGCEVFPPYALVVVSPAYAGAAVADARTDCRPRYVRWTHPASARAGLLRLLLLFRRILLSASIRYAPLVGVLALLPGLLLVFPVAFRAAISF